MSLMTIKTDALGTVFKVSDVDENLYATYDIIDSWPNELGKKEQQLVQRLFDKEIFWKWADPWEITIGTSSSRAHI